MTLNEKKRREKKERFLVRIEKKKEKDFSIVGIKKVPTHWKGLDIKENRREDFWLWKLRDLKSPRLESDSKFVFLFSHFMI